jgi:hypothetical protein
MKIQTLLLLGALGTLALSGCSENGVNCDEQSQTVQWHLDTLVIADRVAVNGIWGVDQSDVYAVGMVDSGQGPMGTVWHYDGTDWSVVHTRANAELQDVHIVSANSVWIAGIGNPDSYPGEALVLHWNGSSWEESYADPSVPGLLAVWAGADNDLYATGRDGTVLHYDGVVWSQEDIYANGLEEIRFGDVQDVWGVADGASRKVYLAGGYASGIVLSRVADGPWQLDFLMPYGPSDGKCVGVWSRSVSDVYALERTGQGQVPLGRVYRYEDTAWVRTQLSSATGVFQTIRGDRNGDVFALGWSIYRFEGDTLAVYNEFPGHGTYALNDIWPSGPTILVAGSSATHALVLRGLATECTGTNN